MSTSHPVPTAEVQNNSEATSEVDPVPATNNMQPVSVLFVCLGNICRSTMAEAVFRSKAKSHPAIAKIDSAGTAAYYHEGDPPDSRTMDVLEDNGIQDYDHEARKVVPADLTEFDYILAMDRQNLSDLNRMKAQLLKREPDSAGQIGTIALFGDYGGRQGEQVVDPYYGARNGFSIAYEQMTRFTDGFVTQVLENAAE